MKVVLSIILLILFFIPSSASSSYNGIPVKYHAHLDRAFQKAGQNRPALLETLNKSPRKQKEAFAFLLSWMPERDLQTLSGEFIASQVEWAYRAKREFKWCAALPDTIFYNEVLPYYCLDEQRDNWRKDFYNKFRPFVKNCKTVFEAIDSVNLNIRDQLEVDYNVKRSIVNISPFKAISEKMATCTGLSFLLIDAFRSVGIPARLAGTPLWTNLRGNHNWVEVWIDGKWYFTEYYPDKLNKSWFVADAGKADPRNPEHWIYATSYKPADTYFPLVWDKKNKEIHGCNVTERYIQLYQEQLADEKLKENEQILNFVLYPDSASLNIPDKRIPAKLTVKEAGKVVDFGFTPGPTDDFNKFLKIKLKKNDRYVLQIETQGHEPITKEINSGGQNDAIITLLLK